MTDQFGRPYDLDQSGRGFHKSRSYLGPSLGWVETQILPERKINAAGTYDIDPGDQVILIEEGLPSTFHLPDVKAWQAQNATLPATGWSRGIIIKDYGGNSLTQHITIVPFDDQTIDGLNQSFVLAQNFGTMSFHPLVDGTGWYVSAQTYDTGTGGTTAINPTAPITGNVVGNVMNVAMKFDTSAFKTDVNGNFQLQTMAPGFVFGNATGVAATPIGQPLTAMFDRGFGTTQGSILFRNNANWIILPPGTSGQSLVSGGAGGNPSWQTVIGGNVSNNGVPTAGQIAEWTDSTHIRGINKSSLGYVQSSGPITSQYLAYWPDNLGTNISAAFPGDGLQFAASVLSVNFQEVQRQDPDLDALAALTGTNTIYYRSGTNTWSPVTMGANMSFSGGVLNSIGGGGSGNVTASGTPTNGQLAMWTSATAIQGVDVSALGLAPIASPVFTGDPQAPTPATADNDQSIATTAFVKAQNYTTQAAVLAAVAAAYQPLDTQLTAFAALGGGADLVPFFTSTSAMNSFVVSAAMRATLNAPSTSTFLGNIGAQPFDADLTSIAGYTGTGTWLYRSAADTWSAVTIGSGLTFVSGVLTASGGGGGGDVFKANDNQFTANNYFTGITVLGAASAIPVFTDPNTKTQIVNSAIGFGQWSADTTGPILNLYKSRSAAIGTETLVLSGDRLANIQFMGSDGSTGITAAAIRGLVDGGTGGGNMPGRLEFLTRPGAGTLANAITIKSTGQVIIGNIVSNTSLSAKLQIHQNPNLDLLQWSADTIPNRMQFSKSRGAAIGTLAAVQNGDSIGVIDFAGVNSSNTFAIGAEIVASCAGAPTARVPMGFGFNTDDGAALARRLTITSPGGITIGPMPFSLYGNMLELNMEAAMSGAGNGIGLQKWSNDGGGPEVYLRKSRGATTNIFTAVQAGDNIGSIYFLGAAASGFVSAGAISVDATGAPTTAVPSTMRFNLGTASATITCMLLSPVAGQNILGTTIANDATAGLVGELLASSFTNSQVTAGASTDIGTLILTAGDWDLWSQGYVGNLSGAGGGSWTAGFNTVANTLPTGSGNLISGTYPANGTMPFYIQNRVTIGTTTTLRFVASASATNANFVGGMFARRRR